MAQFTNYAAIPQQVPQYAGIDTVLNNFIKGYQTAALPKQMQQQQEAAALQQQLAQYQLQAAPEQLKALQLQNRGSELANQYAPQQEAAKLALFQAQAKAAGQPKQYAPTEVEKLIQAQGMYDPNSPQGKIIADRLNKLTAQSNGITIGKDPVTGDQTIQIGGAQSGLQKSATGEEPAYEINPTNGKQEQIGVYVKPTTKDIEEASGRGFFNYTIPFLNKSTSVYSGKGGNEKFESDLANFDVDKDAHANIVNFLAATKLLPSSAVKENAAIGGPNTQKIINELKSSLNSSDVPAILKSIGTQYQLPGSANKEASDLFQKMVNEATEKGQKSIPARILRRFEPSKSNASESKYNIPSGFTLMFSKDGRPHSIPNDKVELALQKEYRRG